MICDVRVVRVKVSVWRAADPGFRFPLAACGFFPNRVIPVT